MLAGFLLGESVAPLRRISVSQPDKYFKSHADALGQRP